VRVTTENRYRADESRLETDYVFEDVDGLVERARGAHHVHTTGEIVRMLHGAGFADVTLLSADGRTAYQLGSPRLIAVATPRATPAAGAPAAVAHRERECHTSGMYQLTRDGLSRWKRSSM
jgi:hypothetical protein